MRGLFDVSGGGSAISYTPEVVNGQLNDLLFVAKPLELGFVTISASVLHFGGAEMVTKPNSRGFATNRRSPFQ